MPDINKSIAHMTAWDGTVFQVLNAEGDDWDEAATAEALNAWQAGNPSPAEIAAAPPVEEPMAEEDQPSQPEAEG